MRWTVCVARHTELPVLIPTCVSCMGMLRVMQYAYSKCACVHVWECAQARQKRRKRQREGESKSISKGIKPKPQDISDLEGEWVKLGGWGEERGEEKKKRGKLKERNKEMEGVKAGRGDFAGQLENLQNPLLKPTIKFQLKPQNQYEDWRGFLLPTVCVFTFVCVCLCHAHIYLCACHMWLKGLSRGGQEADEWCNPWKQSRRHQGGRKEGREERKEELLLLGIQLSRNVLTVVAHTVGECCILEKILRRW